MSDPYLIIAVRMHGLSTTLDTARAQHASAGVIAQLEVDLADCEYLAQAAVRRSISPAEPIDDNRNDGWDDTGFAPDRQPRMEYVTAVQSPSVLEAVRRAEAARRSSRASARQVDATAVRHPATWL